MATVGGLSSGTSTQLYGASVHGYTGMASGLDVDSLIEGMTVGTRTKIASKLQDKQKLQWEQNAFQSISGKLINMQQKFLDKTASNSLLRSSTFAKSVITTKGTNASAVTVSGASDMLDRMSINSITQLAKNASFTTNDNASKKIMQTGSFTLNEDVDLQNLAGQSLMFEYGNKSYSVTLSASEQYKNGKEAAESINKALSKVKLASGDTLADKVKVEFDSAMNKISFVDQGSGNQVSLRGGSEAAIKALGLEGMDLSEHGNISTSGALTADKAITEDDLITKKPRYMLLAGKSMTFSLNGTSKSITLPEEDELKIMSVDDLAKSIEKSLAKEFGKGKISVVEESGSLKFTTADENSVLLFASADSGVAGENGIKLDSGSANRLNLDKSVKEMYKDLSKFINSTDNSLNLVINGENITGLTADSTVREIMQAINEQNVGVKVSYLSTVDRFTISSTISGKSGEIDFSSTGGDNFAAQLFGNGQSVQGTTVPGQDAVFEVQYEGVDNPITITRDTNSFQFEGASFTLNSLFTATNGKDEEKITFSAAPDTEKVVQQVSDMIEAYNAVLEETFKEAGTRPNRDYAPLTDEQKAEMSQDQIATWEEKAKAGILFNDSTLVSLSNALRRVFSSVTDTGTLKKMGIALSTDYTEHGKITFDEEKFKAALNEDPKKVQELFMGTDGTGGFMGNLNKTYTTFAKKDGAPKGSLLLKAGSPYASTTIANNTIQRKIDEIDEEVAVLKKKLQKEIDRNNSKFTQLETLISQMNSQSNVLSQFGS